MKTDIPWQRGIAECEAGEAITFDAERQVWIPGEEELSARYTTLAVLKAPVRFEEAVGMRSREIQFEIVESWAAPVEAVNG